MTKPIKLADVVVEMECQFDDNRLFLNRKSGKMVHTGLEEFEDWVALPNKFEIHEWDIMRRFSLEQVEEDREELLNAIRGRGAFRMFKAVIRGLALEEDWYSFRSSQLKRLAADCLELHGIPFED